VLKSSNGDGLRLRRATLIAVKTARIWLLILLAVLLPIRGAVAAAMLCPPTGTAHHQEQRVHAHHGSHAAVDSAEHHHDHADGAQHGHDDHHSSSGMSDKCNLCSACCTVAPMVSSPPTLPMLLGVTDVRFPSVSAPAPTFVLDVQERPPRTV
jgi:hypothetical protein